MATINVNGERREVQAPGDTPLLYVLRNDLHLVGPAVWLRPGSMRRLFGADRRQGSAIVHHGAFRCHSQSGDHHARRIARKVGKAKRTFRRRSEDHASPRSAGMDRGADSAVRLLPERHDHQGNRAARKHSQSVTATNQGSVHNFRRVTQSLPLWNLRRDHRSRATRCHADGKGEVSDADEER